jgi:hypothetical protein
MLPLKAPVNPLQNALGYANCFIGAFAFLDGCLKHHDAGLTLEHSADCFNVEFPQSCDLRGGIVTLSCCRHLGKRGSCISFSRVLLAH